MKIIIVLLLVSLCFSLPIDDNIRTLELPKDYLRPLSHEKCRQISKILESHIVFMDSLIMTLEDKK